VWRFNFNAGKKFDKILYKSGPKIPSTASGRVFTKEVVDPAPFTVRFFQTTPTILADLPSC
jgi:hypothetical protein